MKTKVEAWGLKIGVDNTITDALHSGKWGIRFCFHESTNRYDVILSCEEAIALKDKIDKCLADVAKVKGMMNAK